MKQICKIIFICISIALLLLPVTSCAEYGSKTVMEVGGNKVSYDEYRYFYMNYRAAHNHQHEPGSDCQAELKQNVESALRQKYAKINLAKEHGVTLNSDEQNEIAAMVDYYIENFGGSQPFNEALADRYMTHEFFVDALRQNSVEEKLREYLYNEYTGNILSDDATVESFIYDNFISATHILILNEAGDDISANFELAKTLHARAMAGENFDALVDEYGEDSGMQDGLYYFTQGQMVPVFEEAAELLEIGGISDVVLSEHGYHIIKRLALEPGYIDEHFEELREAFKARKFNIQIEELAASLEIKYTNFYDTLDEAAIITPPSK